MKHLPIATTSYKVHLNQFNKHLSTLGYHWNTQEMVTSSAREFLHYLEQYEIYPLPSVQAETITLYHQYLCKRPNKRGGGLSSKTINLHMYALKQFFTFLQNIGIIACHPMSTLNFPSGDSKPREVLTKEEVKILYEQSENLRDKAMLSLLYGCGLRISEAVNLDVNDIHYGNQLLYVREGKGKKRRVVPMSHQVTQTLKEYYFKQRQHYAKDTADSKVAFMLNRYGERLCGGSYNYRLKQLLVKAQIEKTVSLHNLRHSIATHLLENGLSLEYVRDFLGHEFLETTQIYTRVSKRLLMQRI